MDTDKMAKAKQLAEDLAQAGYTAKEIFFKSDKNTLWLLVGFPDGQPPGIASNVDAERIPDFLRFLADSIEIARKVGETLEFSERDDKRDLH